jgi:hypothetical protein
VQPALANSVDSPYTPPGQGVQAAAPASEYVPGAQATAVALVEPRGHAYPALQGPEQFDEVRPKVEPYRPPGQLLHVDALPVEYLPGSQYAAADDTDPAGQ